MSEKAATVQTSKLRCQGEFMNNLHPAYNAFSVVILVPAFASLAQAATSTRTWFSGVGSDSNQAGGTINSYGNNEIGRQHH
jgi:hypothetical protein